MSDRCELRATQGDHLPCDEERCVYWRVVGHLGVEGPQDGCAVQYFQLLEDGEDVATWLLSVKMRVEGVGGAASDPECSDG